jgi:CHAT domain-containing protein
MRQRQLRLLGLIIIGAFLLCNPFNWSAEAAGKPENIPPHPRLIIILVDMSASADQARRTVCKDAFEKIYRNLRQGDRVVVGTITSQSYIEFKPTVDEEIPKKTVWDNRLQYEKKLTDTREKIRREVNKLLSQKQGTPLTEILDSLNIADIIFHDEKERQKVLVMLSDMIQDSKDYKFDKDKMTDEYINNVIRSRQKNKLMPNLANVKVYVAGASAADSDKFRAIQTFWARYFAESGADFSPHRYGHSLINFENGPQPKPAPK